MATVTFPAAAHTIQSILTTASTLGYAKIWTGGDKTRVYLGGAFAELVDGQIVVGNKLRSSCGAMSKLAAALQAADASTDTPVRASVVKPTTAKSTSKAQDWDNLHNEGHRDGGYNPYRRTEQYSSLREMSRHMAAEGGDNY